MVYIANKFHEIQERILQPTTENFTHFTVRNNPDIHRFRISLSVKLYIKKG